MANGDGIPTTLPGTEGPGFFGTLLNILKGTKVAAGPASVIKSGALPGMSYNDFLTIGQQPHEHEELTDFYINLGENMLGMDMSLAKQARAQQKSRGAPPSLGFSKAIQGIVQHGMQYGYRRPLGPAVAESMFPETLTTTTPPTGGLPPIYQRDQAQTPQSPWQPPTDVTAPLGAEPAWQPAPMTPAAITTTRRELTPLQRIIKGEVAQGRPADVVRMLPTIAEHFPDVLEGGMAGDAKATQKRIIDDLRTSNPDMSSDLYNMFMGMPPSAWRGTKLQQSLRLARTYLHEDRQNRRATNAPLRAEQDRYATAVMQLPLSREQQQRALDEIGATTDERGPRQVYARFVGMAPTQSTTETLKAAQTSFNSTLNIYAPRMKPEDVLRWKAAVGRATTPEQVFALEQQMGTTIPAEAPLTEDQKATRVHRLNTDIMGNLSKMTAYSGWLSGNVPYEQAAPLITMPGGGTIAITGNIFGPSRKPRPLASTQGVKSFFAGAFVTIERDIKELEKFDPALATQHRANLQGLRDDVVAGQAGAGGAPPTLPGGTTPKKTQGETDSGTAFREALEARGLTELPTDVAQRNEVLTAYYNLMAARGYDVKELAAGLQRKFKGWAPPAAP
mgnify:FL=1